MIRRKTTSPSATPGRSFLRGLLLLGWCACGTFGCLAHKLRGPAEDHAVVARTVADSCQDGGYGQGKCTAEDLEAVADQAMCIMAITRSRECVPE